MKDNTIIVPDYLSLTTRHIILKRNDFELAYATGFVYELDSRHFLITNWHNVTGTNPLTNLPLGKNPVYPNRILFWNRLKNDVKKSERVKVNLYSDHESINPLWLVHPKYKHKVDLVAIEISNPKENWEYSSISRLQFDNVRPRIGDDLFVIGYPFDYLTQYGFPIWKRASIATEPDLDIDDLPKVLVDTATRSGLSGSPVIYRSSGIHNMVDGVLADDSIIGTITGFLGVYSGRIGDDELKAQLGIVWKAFLIEEIIKGNCFGEIPSQTGNIL